MEITFRFYSLPPIVGNCFLFFPLLVSGLVRSWQLPDNHLGLVAGQTGQLLVGDWAVVAAQWPGLWERVRFTLPGTKEFPFGLGYFLRMSSVGSSARKMPPNMLPPPTQE